GDEAEEMHALEIRDPEAVREEVLPDALARHDERQVLARAPAVLPVRAQQTLVVAARILRQMPVAGVQDTPDSEDESLRQRVLVAEAPQLLRVGLRGEPRTDTRVGDTCARQLQSVADEIVERRLGDREHRPRLATVKRQHGTDVNVVPPGIVPRIHVPVAALQDKDSRNAREE